LSGVSPAAGGKAWHRAFDFDYLPRSPSTTSVFPFAWDGTTTNSDKVNVVPNGQYIIQLTVLKALGDDSDPAHTETWTSPAITLARP
jgi:minor extracellular serine protease Vpr